MNHGVILVYGQLTHKITTNLKGPAKVFLENKQLMYRQGDSPSQSLSAIAEVQAVRIKNDAA